MASRRSFLAASAAAPFSLPAAPAAPVTAEVRPHNGKATLFVNGRPVYPGFFALTDSLGGRWTWEEIPQQALRDFAAAGFRLFQVDLFLESLWSKPGPLDIALARRQLRGVLDACPKAAIVLRWHVNAPRWWNAAHPEECTRYANGDFETIDRTQPVRILMDDLRRVPRASLASALWRRTATEKTVELLRALAAAPEGRALAGVHPAGGVYGEWHYWGFMRNEPDTSAPMQAHFDAWRKAHGKAPAPVPSIADRAALDDGIFRDPLKRETVIDYYHAQQELVADLIIHFCGTVRRHWPRRLLTGVFYGYFFSLFDRSAIGGHLCLQEGAGIPRCRLLERPPGLRRLLPRPRRLRHHPRSRRKRPPPRQALSRRDGPDPLLAVAEQRRHLLPPHRPRLRRRRPPPQRNHQLHPRRRYYDFGPANSAGWWSDTRLMAEIKRLHALLTRYHERPYQPAADVLFVFDTEVFYYTGSIQGSDPLTDVKAVNATIVSAWPAGAALETIHLADLPKVDLNRYRVIVFANTWLLSAEQRKFIRDRVISPTRHVVFQGFPGYTDGRTLSWEFVRETTALDLRDVAKNVSAPLRQGNAWYSPAPPATPAAWREIFRAAQAHLYVETGDIVHAGGGLVLLHTKTGGPRQLRLRSGRTLSLDMPPKSSWIFDATTGDKLLG